MTNIAGKDTKKALAVPRAPAAKAGQVFTGQTFRRLRLTAGDRPFAVVVVDTETDRASGWLMVDPAADAEDPFLKECGVQAADRKKPCYITVPTDLVR